ncbi:MAG: sugar transferase [Patescibacteria group bacterium]|nr:sugar transferase [Patescibacteria group bacterium]MDE1966126.1 sugar transferase [Patescibacteria group bacterium]
MTNGGKKASLLLFIGDILVFAFSLWLTLLIRYAAWPGAELLQPYFTPFAVLFAAWVAVFFINGLYDPRIATFKSRLPDVIVKTQLLNIVLAALFFFAIPGFGITPKTILALYLVISLILIFLWRYSLFTAVAGRRAPQAIVIIGSGPEVEELVAATAAHARFGIECREVIDPATVTSAELPARLAALRAEGVHLLVVDTAHDAARTLLPAVYRTAFEGDGLAFTEFSTLYENVFDRVPLSLLRYEWFLKNLSRPASNFYLFGKRLLDIAGGLVMGLITVAVTPFLWLAVKIEDGGPLFISQERIGQYGRHMKVYKFRSMRAHDQASGEWTTEGKNEVTRTGRFLRVTSLDEFPQFVNVLAGEISLIGPRNDILGLGIRLSEAISYYEVRYIVKPGITGWAQINQRYEPGHISPQSVEETKLRLAYDFYYIKNRSFGLDIIIALRTVKRMFFRMSAV